jgi:hypothetical protein
VSAPPINDTDALRKFIEQPERCRFWGEPHTITPRLITAKFGDGQQLLCVTPFATRPNYFAAARTAEEAIAIVQQGTAWPQSYDEITVECVDGEPVAEDITTDELIECWGDPNDPNNTWRTP